MTLVVTSTPIPEPITFPLPYLAESTSNPDMNKIQDAIQQLQDKVNQLIAYNTELKAVLTARLP